jgi:hypothetical protein
MAHGKKCLQFSQNTYFYLHRSSPIAFKSQYTLSRRKLETGFRQREKKFFQKLFAAGNVALWLQVQYRVSGVAPNPVMETADEITGLSITVKISGFSVAIEIAGIAIAVETANIAIPVAIAVALGKFFLQRECPAVTALRRVCIHK